MVAKIENFVISPILSEKSAKMMENLNKYVFKVSLKANKLQIKSEIEKRFKVEISKVSTMNFKGKSKTIIHLPTMYKGHKNALYT